MGNHHLFNSEAVDISQNDTWHVLTTNDLPDGIALTHISLLEILQKQEKLDVLLPLSDLLILRAILLAVYCKRCMNYSLNIPAILVSG